MLLSACQLAHSGPTTQPTSQTTSASEASVDLHVSPAIAAVDKNDELTLYTTLIFRTEQEHPVTIYPFAWGAYTLSSPDVEIERSPPADSPEAHIIGSAREAMRLTELSISVRQLPVAIDYRLAPGENWIYRLGKSRAGFNGQIHFLLKYSFNGIQSNEANFVVQVAGWGAGDASR
jgi:hypothetical protein